MDERLVRLGLSALIGNFKTLEVLARRGLISPQEVEHIWGEITFAFGGDEPTEEAGLASIVAVHLDPL